MPEHADRVQYLDISISASIHAHSNVPTARLIADRLIG